MRRYSSSRTLPVLPLVGLVSAGIVAGCTPDMDDSSTRLCRDAAGRPVADAQCQRGGGGFHYAYLGSGRAVPAVGQPISGYRDSPGNGEVRSAEGRVVRGGLGHSARGSAWS